MTDMAQRPSRAVALLFTGQGTQHLRMAAGLYGTEESFTTWMDRTFELFGAVGPRLREQWLATEPSPMFDDVSVAQPLLYAVNHALGRMLLGWGVRPVALLGHSAGELAAATLAGVFDFADGVRLMRGRIGQFADTPPGGMLAVAASVDDVADVLPLGAHVAAVNASRQVLLSGALGPLREAARVLAARGVVCREVPARQAFHSPLVASAATAALPDWQAVRLRPPRLTLYSAYTGGLLDDLTAVDPAFWADQAVATVYFGPALTRLLADHDCLLVECGPGNSLSTLARRQPAVISRSSAVQPLLPDRPRGDVADLRAVAEARRRLRSEGALGAAAHPPGREPSPVRLR
ncbi:acyltransferase domain-containing protein [Nonomuraea sp. NPDC046570]|uniref:acyltransferase domain-containing protein n=1 Tax=Nonomuraea sp. NPDC046570 TaxID=3155255 RepID=UPI0033C35F24